MSDRAEDWAATAGPLDCPFCGLDKSSMRFIQCARHAAPITATEIRAMRGEAEARGLALDKAAGRA